MHLWRRQDVTCRVILVFQYCSWSCPDTSYPSLPVFHKPAEEVIWRGGGAYSKLCLCSSTSLPREREEEGGPKISKTRHNYALSFPFSRGGNFRGTRHTTSLFRCICSWDQWSPSSYLPTPPHEHRHKPKEKNIQINSRKNACIDLHVPCTN